MRRRDLSAQLEASTVISSISPFYYFPGFIPKFYRFLSFTAEEEGFFAEFRPGLCEPTLGLDCGSRAPYSNEEVGLKEGPACQVN